MRIMNNQPRKITLFSQNSQKRRTIHLVTQTKEKSFRFASVNCQNWVVKNGYPVTFSVSYGKHECTNGKVEEFTNKMTCKDIEDVRYALRAFVKEYYEEERS